VLLALKVIVKKRLIDPSGPGDLIDPRSGQTELGKLFECRRDNGGFCRHRVSFAFARLMSRANLHSGTNLTNYLVNCKRRSFTEGKRREFVQKEAKETKTEVSKASRLTSDVSEASRFTKARAAKPRSSQTRKVSEASRFTEKPEL
jgi:hypothetical protein